MFAFFCRISFALACSLKVMGPMGYLFDAIRFCYSGSFLLAAISMAQVVKMLGGEALAVQGTDDTWVAVVDRKVYSFEVVPCDDFESDESESDDGESDSSEPAAPKALIC